MQLLETSRIFLDINCLQKFKVIESRYDYLYNSKHWPHSILSLIYKYSKVEIGGGSFRAKPFIFTHSVLAVYFMAQNAM